MADGEGQATAVAIIGRLLNCVLVGGHDPEIVAAAVMYLRGNDVPVAIS